MQGIYFPAHQGNASAFGLGLMFRSLTDFFSAFVTAVFSYEIITSFRMHFGCHHSFLSSKGENEIDGGSHQFGCHECCRQESGSSIRLCAMDPHVHVISELCSDCPGGT